MNNKYDLITYNEKDKLILDKTELTKEEKDSIYILKLNLNEKLYTSVIEDIFKFYKNRYTTLQLAGIYNLTPRHIQRILKDLGLKKGMFNSPKASILPICKGEPGNILVNSYISIPERLTEFLNYLEVIKGKSGKTVEGYKIDLTMLFKFLKVYKGLSDQSVQFDEIKIKDIDDNFIKNIKLSDLYAFLSYVEKQRHNSAYARARKVAAIKSFFRYLNTKTRILDENPASDLETPKTDKRNPVYLTLEESKALLSSIDEKYKHQKRNLCIITLFLNCGLRLSELCSINISKIKEDTMTIIGKGNKERTVYLNKASLKTISEYLKERNSLEILSEHKDALFISEKKRRISKRTVEVIVEKYIQAAGLDKTRYTPHKLRHTAATLMYKHGHVDIRSLQKILGHENISTTQIYTHVDDEKLREAVSSNPLSDL